jgi:hypothetical protein
VTKRSGVRKGSGSFGSDFLIKFPKSGMSYGWRELIADKIGIDQASVIKLSNVVQRNEGYEGYEAVLENMAKNLGVMFGLSAATFTIQESKWLG